MKKLLTMWWQIHLTAHSWEQYYRGKEISSILEYAAVLYMTREEEQKKKLSETRWSFINPYRELTSFFLSVWKSLHFTTMQLLEYEQLYHFCWKGKGQVLALSNDQQGRLLEEYDKLSCEETEESLTELMQQYSDAGQYEKAAGIQDYINHSFHSEKEPGKEFQPDLQDLSVGIQEQWTENEEEKYAQLFAARDDIYALAEINEGKRKFSIRKEPLDQSVIHRHLTGEEVVASYVQRNNGTAKYFVIDIDISRRILLQCKPGDEIYRKYLKLAAQCADVLGNRLKKKGLPAAFEFSGFRGYHIWLFFDNWYPVRYFNLLQDVIEQEMDMSLYEGITLEFFPNKTRVKPEMPGQCIKLPLCHMENGEKASVLLDPGLKTPMAFSEWRKKIQMIPLFNLKKALSIKPERTGIPRSADLAEIEKLGEVCESVRAVLTGCSLMRYLCCRAANTGYLTHFERLSILHVFGHIGEEGKEFVHQVMRFTLNYNYNITEKFVRKCPDKPVSCPKLRENFKTVTAELGCSCTFRRRTKCYPSPVLHAVTSSKDISETITLPLSESVTREKKEEVLETVNFHKRAQAVALKILEQKKQRRFLERSIAKLEVELDKIFEEAETMELELEMGLLVRRRTENGREWIIEI